MKHHSHHSSRGDASQLFQIRGIPTAVASRATPVHQTRTLLARGRVRLNSTESPLWTLLAQKGLGRSPVTRKGHRFKSDRDREGVALLFFLFLFLFCSSGRVV